MLLKFKDFYQVENQGKYFGQLTAGQQDHLTRNVKDIIQCLTGFECKLHPNVACSMFTSVEQGQVKNTFYVCCDQCALLLKAVLQKVSPATAFFYTHDYIANWH